MAIITQGVIPASRLVAQAPPAWLTQWASFAHDLRFEDLPVPVVDRAKLVILDCIGAITAGRAEPEVKAAQGLLRPKPGGGHQSALLQAMLDGTAGTSLEIDEGNQYARGHPGIHVVPAVLACSGNRPVSGRDVIVATVLGYEIGARIGIASKLRVAMHPHGTWGTVGAAVGVAKLSGASAADMIQTINIASTLGLTTSRRTMLEGATVRNVYAGMSNMLGMMAWDLAQAGFKGEADGVGSVYSGIVADDWTPSEMIKGLGHHWEILRNYFKRHAACRYNHGALDALAKIVADCGGRLSPNDIKAIAVETYVWAAQLDHPAPETMLGAKFSMPFSLATYIVSGAASLDAFRDAARTDPATRALAAKVRVDENAEFTSRLPTLRPARVTVTLTDGRTFMAQAMTNKGDAEDPYTAAEVQEKFLEIATPVLGKTRAHAILSATLGLDNAQSVQDLVELCEAR
jgi:2-methylcitrate dehydratase PrpD